MVNYIIKRVIHMFFILFVISIISFVLIKLPPGDYLATYISHMQVTGAQIDQECIEILRTQYGLDQPTYIQYGKWMWQVLQGNFGWSFYWKQPVNEILLQRLPFTILLSLITLIFIYVVAIPIAIYSAVKQYSIGDYGFTLMGFIGLATPNFLLALVLMYIFYKYFGISIGGLFSREYAYAPWSFKKIIDLINHSWVPIIVVGTAGTASIIRVLRAMLLDELRKPYVQTARAKGVRERTLLFKYPVRVAINPILSTIGWQLPFIISGFIIVSVVMDLPTIGSVLLTALLAEDMYLAGSIILLLSSLTVIGTLLSDILLCIVDPRIRYYK